MKQISYIGMRHLAHIPSKGALVLLRHAERAQIFKVEDYYQADLTPGGEAAAREFGVRAIEYLHLNTVYCSPVQRCVHTAQALIDGYDHRGPVVPKLQPLSFLHFDPQYWDASFAAQFADWQSYDYRFFESPVSAASCNVAQAIIKHLPLPHALPHDQQTVLAITHDTVIMHLAGYLLGLQSTSVEDAPGFLEGICLIPEGQGVRLFSLS